MKEAFDWEDAMTSTRRSAAAASQNSEHAVAGMAKLLREIDRHSVKLGSQTRSIERLAALLEEQAARSRVVRTRTQPTVPRPSRLLASGFIVAFVAGVAFGGYIAS